MAKRPRYHQRFISDEEIPLVLFQMSDDESTHSSGDDSDTSFENEFESDGENEDASHPQSNQQLSLATSPMQPALPSPPSPLSPASSPTPTVPPTLATLPSPSIQVGSPSLPSPPVQPLQATLPSIITPSSLPTAPIPSPLRLNTLQWTWASVNSVTPVLFDFSRQNSGISPSSGISEHSSELDIFSTYFDVEIMDHIVQETNKYYAFSRGPSILSPFSRLLQWKDTNVAEMYVFLAVMMLMTFGKKFSLDEYWSKDPLITMPIFSKIMSSNRFFLLLRMLHFNDNTVNPRNDPLYKIRPVFDRLTKKMKGLFYPFQDLVIDESLMLFKGRLSFRMFIPSKRHRFGIKLYMLCDCETGMVLDIIVYTGKTTDVPSDDVLGASGAVVREMLKDLLGKGHNLYIDNWYTSPNLAAFLHQNKTGVCGTVRSHRKNMPEFSKLKKGESQSFYANNILAMKWHDKRDVTMLTTLNEGKMVQSDKTDRHTGQPVMKPDAVLAYNENMRLIDKCDMQVSSVECLRKSRKWYVKLFFHLVDVVVLNSYNLYLTATGEKPPLKEFRLNLVRQILEKYGNPDRVPNGGRRSDNSTMPLRLTARHFPDVLPSTEKKKYAMKPCFVCNHTKRKVKKRKDTRYQCKECDVPLCLIPCFKEYHTMSNF